MCACATYAYSAHRGQVPIPGTAFTDGWKGPHEYWELNPDPLQKQHVLWIPEPSLQHHPTLIFYLLLVLHTYMAHRTCVAEVRYNFWELLLSCHVVWGNIKPILLSPLHLTRTWRLQMWVLMYPDFTWAFQTDLRSTGFCTYTPRALWSTHFPHGFETGSHYVTRLAILLLLLTSQYRDYR